MEQNTARIIVNVYAVLAWLGALFLLLIGLAFIFGGSLFNFLVSSPVSWMTGEPLPTGMAAGIIGAAAVVVGVVIVLFAVLYLFVGLALWRRAAWGRIAAIVLGVLQVFSFPIGTIIGAFAIWFFGFSNDGKAQFGSKPVIEVRKKR